MGKELVKNHTFHCISIYFPSKANSITSPTNISAYTRSIIISITVISSSATRHRVCASLVGPRARRNTLVIITTFQMAATSTAITFVPRVTPAEFAATRVSIAAHALPSTGRHYGSVHLHPGPEIERSLSRCCGWSEPDHPTTSQKA